MNDPVLYFCSTFERRLEYRNALEQLERSGAAERLERLELDFSVEGLNGAKRLNGVNVLNVSLAVVAHAIAKVA